MFPAAFALIHESMNPVALESLNIVRKCYAPFVATATHIRDLSPKAAVLYHKIEAVFFAVDFGLFAYDLSELMGHVLFKYDWINHIGSLSFELVGNVAFFGWILLACVTVKHINNKFYRRDYATFLNDIQLDQGQTISFYKTSSIQFQQFSYITRITLSIALAAFSLQTPLFCAFNVACLAYSLWKVSNQHWMQLSQTFNHDHPNVVTSRAAMQSEFEPDVKIGDEIYSVEVAYYFPLIFRKNGNRQPNPEIYFCEEHTYPLSTFPRYFFSKFGNILHNWHFRRTISSDSSIITYPSSLPSSHLPNCPTCSKKPITDHRIFLWITERRASYPRGSGLVTLREGD